MTMHTVQEVAEQFEVSHQTVRKWVRDGRLHCFNVEDVFRFSDEQLSDFISRNTTNSKCQVSKHAARESHVFVKEHTRKVLRERILTFLYALPTPVTKRKVIKSVAGRHNDICSVLSQLAAEELITITTDSGVRGSTKSHPAQLVAITVRGMLSRDKAARIKETDGTGTIHEQVRG